LLCLLRLRAGNYEFQPIERVPCANRGNPRSRGRFDMRERNGLDRFDTLAQLGGRRMAAGGGRATRRG
jgi:hypothetical protein